MRSALDAWLLSGGVGGDVCDVAHVQGGVLRVSRGRGVARLVIGVVILRGVVGPEIDSGGDPKAYSIRFMSPSPSGSASS